MKVTSRFPYFNCFTVSFILSNVIFGKVSFKLCIVQCSDVPTVLSFEVVLYISAYFFPLTLLFSLFLFLSTIGEKERGVGLLSICSFLENGSEFAKLFFTNVSQFSFLFKRRYFVIIFLTFCGECLSNSPPLKGIPTTCSSRGSSQVNSLLLPLLLLGERKKKEKERGIFLPPFPFLATCKNQPPRTTAHS